MKKKIGLIGLILMIIALQTPVAYGQDNVNTLSKQNKLDDFKYFVKLLEETHVDPYTPIGGKLNFHIRAAKFRSQIEKSDCEDVNLSLVITEFLAYLKDNHTGVNLKNAIDWNNNKQLPFRCDVATDAIYVNSVRTKYKHLYGAKILSVNNTDIDDLLLKSSKLQPAENISNLKANLCTQIINLKSAQQLFPRIGNTLNFKFVTSKLDTIQQSIDFYSTKKLNDLQSYKSQANLRINKSGIFSYQFVDSENNIMYFRLEEMFAQEVIEMINRNNTNYRNWVYSMLNYYPKLNSISNKEKAAKQIPYFSAAFREMLEKMKQKKSEFLILDLSDNVGGYSSLARPALYMLHGNKCFSGEFEWKSVRRISQLFLDKHNITIDQFNRGNNKAFDIGDYDVSNFIDKEESLEDYKAKEKKYFTHLKNNGYGWAKYIRDLDGQPIYSPKIIILTNATTNSAAYHFLYYLHKLGKVTVIGIAPKQAGNTPMEGTKFVLPNSNIHGSISNSYQILFPAKDKKSEIYMPDFPVNWIDLQTKGMSSTAIIEIAIDLIRNGKI